MQPAAGAMENWGLITYREIAILIDEKNSSIVQKQRVAYVVAHECNVMIEIPTNILTPSLKWPINGSVILLPWNGGKSFGNLSIRHCHVIFHLTLMPYKMIRLNEGFATFVGNQAVDYLYPNWNIWTQFVSSNPLYMKGDKRRGEEEITTLSLCLFFNSFQR